MQLHGVAEWEPIARLGAFLALAVIFWTVEWLIPRRLDAPLRVPRQFVNLALVAINTVVLRLAVPLLAVDMARLAADQQWGLLNWFDLSGWPAVLLAFVILDLVVYWQHRLFHRWSLAWRFHRMHHSDTFFDVSTGVRFHPLEIMASMAIKIAVVAALGAPALGVILFEIVLNGSSLFNHSNVRIWSALERAIRLVIVTPDMHRVHHSVLAVEHNKNFGFNLSVWDRLFGTYRHAPKDGHTAMQLGLSQFRAPKDQTLTRLLVQPFAGGSRQASIP